MLQTIYARRGMVTAPLISMFAVPAAWMLLRRREIRRRERLAAKEAPA